jgi:hypothetical protein
MFGIGGLLFLLHRDESNLNAVAIVLSLELGAYLFDGLKQHVLKQIAVEDSETLRVDVEF